MIVGYARVSTEEQNLDLQLRELKAYRCDAIYSDHGVSGVRFERHGLLQALEGLGRGDTLVVWKLDRLGRSLQHLVTVMSELEQRGVRLVSLTEHIDTISSTGRLTFHIIAALAEFERSLISERTRAGMVAARERGRKIGRPASLSVQQKEEIRKMVELMPPAEVARIFNVHVQTVRRHLVVPG
jgi:DNA invertase Pin-like site-specific DNA recombinase